MSTRLRLATFNLENLTDEIGDKPFEERTAILRPQLERLDADLLCLQEVNGQRDAKGEPRRLRALDRLLTGTAYENFHRVATPGSHPDGVADRHNLVILSRWPIGAHHIHRHDRVPSPELRLVTADPPAPEPHPVVWDRPVQHAEIDLPCGRHLHLFNLHLRAPLASAIPGGTESAGVWNSVGAWAEGFFVSALKRAGQALETRLVIEQVFDADPGALIVVAGDYNAEIRETPVRVIRGDTEDTGNGRLAARMLVPLERSLAEAQRFSVLHAGQAVMLDHLLVSRPMLGWFRQMQVHNEALGDELVAHTVVHRSPESYHAPLVAEFAMPDAED
jgi:hypothetical protein